VACFVVIPTLLKAIDTKQPPAKAGGFELRTGSPDTRRLNDASYGGFILNSSFGLGFLIATGFPNAP
jgi:hypothetical protein